MKEIRALLVKDMKEIQISLKEEYKRRGKGEIYMKFIKVHEELKQFEFMINKYERKLRMKTNKRKK